MWSGRSERATIVEKIEARNLQERCSYVGWVDTKTYVNVLDLYLDSFPFPGGHTTIEAMVAETPIVSLVTEDAKRITAFIFVEPWFKRDVNEIEKQGLEPIFTGKNGENLLPFVSNLDEYIERGKEILTDKSFRQQYTQASRYFVEKYLTNFELAGEMLAQHIMDVRSECGLEYSNESN